MTYYRQEQRSRKKEKEMTKKQEDKMNRKKWHLFMHVGCNSWDINFFLCGYTFVVIRHLDGQNGGKGFLKITHSLWHRTVLAWKAGCFKGLIQAVGLSCKHWIMTLPAPCCGHQQEKMWRFQQWYFVPRKTDHIPSHLTSHSLALRVVQYGHLRSSRLIRTQNEENLKISPT